MMRKKSFVETFKIFITHPIYIGSPFGWVVNIILSFIIYRVSNQWPLPLLQLYWWLYKKLVGEMGHLLKLVTPIVGVARKNVFVLNGAPCIF